MQIGLLKYSPSPKSNIFNIGDYIQSLAVKQFINSSDVCLVDRERLDEYQGPELKMVLNGWFMHNPQHWPPSSLIHPLFVAFHLNSSVDDYLLSEESIEYFKKNEPIGCRDYRTVDVLKAQGVEAYFSACMTLTLGAKKKYGTQKNSNIYFTDPFFLTVRNPVFYLKHLLRIFFSLRTILSLNRKMFSSFSIANMIRACSFYIQYSSVFTDELLRKVLFIKQEISSEPFVSEKQKFDYAESVLEMYSNASLVVTSRIHCALPCLALETPVLYVDKLGVSNMDSCRLDGLRELFNVISLQKSKLKLDFEFAEHKISSNSKIMNKPNYKVYREQLIEKCVKFFNL